MKSKFRFDFSDPEYLPFEKKTGPGKIRTQDLFRPRRICYQRVKCTRDTKKFEIIIKQGISGVQ